MRAELRAKIIAYNRALSARREKAQDLDILITALLQLPPGQLKKVLSEDVLSVLSKYAAIPEGEYREER